MSGLCILLSEIEEDGLYCCTRRLHKLYCFNVDHLIDTSLSNVGLSYNTNVTSQYQRHGIGLCFCGMDNKQCAAVHES